MIPATAVIVAVAPAIVIAIAAVTTDAARIAATRVVVAAIIVRAIIESAVPHASAVDRQQAGAVSLDAAPYILRVDLSLIHIWWWFRSSPASPYWDAA